MKHFWNKTPQTGCVPTLFSLAETLSLKRVKMGKKNVLSKSIWNLRACADVDMQDEFHGTILSCPFSRLFTFQFPSASVVENAATLYWWDALEMYSETLPDSPSASG